MTPRSMRFNSYAVMWLVFSLFGVIFYWNPFTYLLGYGPLRIFYSHSILEFIFSFFYLCILLAPLIIIFQGVRKTRLSMIASGEKVRVFQALSYICITGMLAGLAYFIFMSLY